MTRPDPAEYAPFYATYINLVPEDDVLGAMQQQAGATRQRLAALQERPEHRYAPGKWTVRQVVGHMLDTERVFGGRALFIARNDPADLPGFEQDHWMAHSDFSRYALPDLSAEFGLVRAGHLSFLHHLPAEVWDRRGTAAGNVFSVRALAYALLGHERHHLGILTTRYS